jgi:predicted transglutaminase-like cysteine proteinase
MTIGLGLKSLAVALIAGLILGVILAHLLSTGNEGGVQLGVLKQVDWVHGENDEPVASVVLLCSVWNLTNSPLRLELEARLDGWMGKESLGVLRPHQLRSVQFSLLLPPGSYSGLMRVSGERENFTTFTLDLQLPRIPEGREKMVFVTPECPEVKRLVAELEGGENLPEIYREWISTHLSYVPDNEAYRQPDYWQLPRETLKLGRGDCEDFALLLCSMLRASGYPAERVFMAICRKGDAKHVLVLLDNKLIEPYLPFGEAVGYEIEEVFNDIYPPA